MIAYLDIEVHAENPQLPLGPCVAFVGSPSNVRILNVPNGIGSWKIDAVAVAFTRPDNSITTVNAVNVAGCWVATLPASDVGGRCDKGFQVVASGIDENGNAVTGYVLGAGDVVILPRDGTAVSDGVQYYLHYRDAMPTTPRKGDTCLIDGTLKWYDGSAWQTFAAGGSGVEVVPPSTDPADAGKAADAKATGDALAGKLSPYTPWTVERNGVDITAQVGQPFWNGNFGGWDITDCYIDGERGTDFAMGGIDATEISWTEQEEIGVYVAVRRASIPAASDATPQMDGTAAAGSSAAFSRGDHVHPKDASKQDAISDLAAIRSGAQAGATAVQPAALAGAVRYDLGAATATAALPSSAFPIEYTWYDETLGEFVTHTAANAAAVTLEADSDMDNPGGWQLLHESRAIARFDAYGEYTDNWQDAHLGTITFGELANPPSLVFTVQLTDREVQKVTLNGATTTLVLPALTDLSGKVADFGIDVVNAYEESGTPAAASFQLSGTLGTDYNLVVPDGEDWSDMTALAAGEMAVYYFTLSAFRIGDLPTWEVVKKVVELVPVPTAP